MLSKVNFFISKMHEACKVSERDWYITIFNCDGTLLEFDNREYIVIQANGGHGTIKLPPGKYVAVAVWGYWMQDGKYWGNHFTNKAIFQVCCGEHKCVWLYNPSVHECGIIWDRAVRAMQPNLNQAEADMVAAGVDPADPRMVAINDMRQAINNNLPAVQALKAQVDSFFDVFVGDTLEPGTDINRQELLGETPDPVEMVNLVARNSEKLDEQFKVSAEVTGSIS